MSSIRMQCEIPHEILANELLPWLPAKSLLRFRCVCKAWRALISDPHFVETQLLRQQSQGASISNHGTLISSHQQIDFLFPWHSPLSSIVVGSGDAIATKREIGCHYDPLCSCNGLVLVKTHRLNLALWNPCIQSLRTLPLWADNGNYRAGFDTPEVALGFGYDAKIKDYKLVRIGFVSASASINGRRISDTQHQVLVFTLGTNSWRSIANTTYFFDSRKRAMFINGSLYWRQSGKRNKLICFDIHDEVFSELRLPHVLFEKADLSVKVEIGELGGCLVLVHESTENPNSGVCHEVWVMKENWVKMYSISMSRSLCKKYQNPIVPVGSISINNNNDNNNMKKKKKRALEVVYVSSNGRLFSYNLSTNRFRRFKVQGGRNRRYYSLVAYVQSLLSVDISDLKEKICRLARIWV